MADLETPPVEAANGGTDLPHKPKVDEHDEILNKTALEMKYQPDAMTALAAMVSRAKTEGLSLQVITNEWLPPSTDRRDGVGFNLDGTDYWLDRIGRTMMRDNSRPPRDIVNETVSAPGFKRAFDSRVELKKGGPPHVSATVNAQQVAKLFSS